MQKWPLIHEWMTRLGGELIKSTHSGAMVNLIEHLGEYENALHWCPNWFIGREKHFSCGGMNLLGFRSANASETFLVLSPPISEVGVHNPLIKRNLPYAWCLLKYQSPLQYFVGRLYYSRTRWEVYSFCIVLRYCPVYSSFCQFLQNSSTIALWNCAFNLFLEPLPLKSFYKHFCNFSYFIFLFCLVGRPNISP